MNRLLRPTLRTSKKILFRRAGSASGVTPPFARMAPPTSSIPDDVELVWDDSVAPESAIDFDAPHVSTSEAVMMFLMGFGIFFGFYKLVAAAEPAEKNPVAIRDYALPNNASIDAIGYHSSVVDKLKEKRNKELGIVKT